MAAAAAASVSGGVIVIDADAIMAETGAIAVGVDAEDMMAEKGVTTPPALAMTWWLTALVEWAGGGRGGGGRVSIIGEERCARPRCALGGAPVVVVVDVDVIVVDIKDAAADSCGGVDAGEEPANAAKEGATITPFDAVVGGAIHEGGGGGGCCCCVGGGGGAPPRMSSTSSASSMSSSESSSSPPGAPEVDLSRSFLLFIRRFWNQILTWRSVRLVR